MKRLLAALKSKGKMHLYNKVKKVLAYPWQLKNYATSLGNTLYLLSNELDGKTTGNDRFAIIMDEGDITDKGIGFLTLMDWDGNDLGRLKLKLSIGGDKHYPTYSFENIKVVNKFKNKKIEKILITILKNIKEDLNADYDVNDQIEEVTIKLATKIYNTTKPFLMKMEKEAESKE